MYRLAAIETEMVKRVGFYQTTHPKLPKLLPALLQSQSGIFMQARHPLLNTNNLYMAAENFSQWPYDDWSVPGPGLGYDEGDYVKHLLTAQNIPRVWISAVDNNEVEPGANASWTEVDNFSQYLLSIQKQAVQRTLAKLFEYKKLERNTKTQFQNAYIYDGPSNINAAIIKQGRFVGFRLRLAAQKHLALIIKKIGTQFSAPNPTPLTIYVYHSSQRAAVFTVDVNITQQYSSEWTDIDDLVLPYDGGTMDTGGIWYIGYYEDDLAPGVQALNKPNYDFTKAICKNCKNGMDFSYYTMWSPYMSIMPFAVGQNDINVDKTIFDIHKTGMICCNTWGLNLNLSVRCDLTQFINENLDTFDEAFATQFTYELLNSFVFTLRDNGDSKQVRANAAMELSRTDESGITRVMEKAFKALNFDMSGFNSVCLPCDKPKGVRTGVMR